MDITQLPNSESKLWQPTQFQTSDIDTKTLIYDDFNHFSDWFGDTEMFPAHLNVVIDFYLSNYYLGSNERTSLNLLVFHPRKACFRGIIINSVTVSDLGKIKRYLAKSKRLHNENFKWVPNIK